MRLRVACLILWRVGHGDRRTVCQLHASAAPSPGVLRPGRQQAARLTSQCADHLQRQAGAGSTISPGADAVYAQPLGRTLRGPAIDSSLAGAIHLQRLLHEREHSGNPVIWAERWYCLGENKGYARAVGARLTRGVSGQQQNEAPLPFAFCAPPGWASRSTAAGLRGHP